MELKNYLEQLLEQVADELNVKKIILDHQSATSVYQFDTMQSKSIGLDDEWPLYSLVFTGKVTEDMNKVKEWVKIGLKQRADEKIKVRQPLQSITITLSSSC